MRRAIGDGSSGTWVRVLRMALRRPRSGSRGCIDVRAAGRDLPLAGASLLGMKPAARHMQGSGGRVRSVART